MVNSVKRKFFEARVADSASTSLSHPDRKDICRVDLLQRAPELQLRLQLRFEHAENLVSLYQYQNSSYLNLYHIVCREPQRWNSDKIFLCCELILLWNDISEVSTYAENH